MADNIFTWVDSNQGTDQKPSFKRITAFDAFQDDDILYMNCYPIMKKELLIKITNGELKDVHKLISGKSQECSNKAINDLKAKVKNVDFDSVYKKDIVWNEYCLNLALLTMYRDVYLQIPVPITPYNLLSNKAKEKYIL